MSITSKSIASQSIVVYYSKLQDSMLAAHCLIDISQIHSILVPHLVSSIPANTFFDHNRRHVQRNKRVLPQVKNTGNSVCFLRRRQITIQPMLQCFSAGPYTICGVNYTNTMRPGLTSYKLCIPRQLKPTV